MTNTPRAIVSDIIRTHQAGKPLTEANGLSMGEPYGPVPLRPQYFYDGDTFLEDLERANKFQLFVFVTFSILLVCAVGAFALVVGLVQRICRFMAGK